MTEPHACKVEPQSAPVPQTEAPVHQASVDGGKVPAEQIKKPSEVNRDDPNINVVELPPRSPTFKEQIYGESSSCHIYFDSEIELATTLGYARLIRGTVLGQPDVKEEGTQVLRGEKSIPLRRNSQESK